MQYIVLPTGLDWGHRIIIYDVTVEVVYICSVILG